MAAHLARNLASILRRAGLTLTVTPERSLKVTPASAITPVLRDLIIQNKSMLIDMIERDAANDPSWPGSPRYWSTSTGMSEQEIALFQRRLDRFSDLGLDIETSERQGDCMLLRDRDGDNRRACIECAHLCTQGRWRCTNARHAELCSTRTDSPVAEEFALLSQRCNGFSAAIQDSSVDMQDNEAEVFPITDEGCLAADF